MHPGLVFLLVAFIIFKPGYSQDELDSLVEAGHRLEGVDKVNNLIKLSRLCFIREDTAGIWYAEQAIELSRKTGYYEGIGKGLLFLGLNVELIDREAAIRYFFRSSDTLVDLGHAWSGFGYENAARIYQNTGWYPEAVSAALKALSAYEKMKDSVQYAKTASSLGYIYNLMGLYDDAIGWQFKALRYLPQTRASDIRGLILGRLGIIYDEMNRPDSADFYNLAAVQIFREIGDQYYLAQWLSNLANTSMKRGDFRQAEEYLQEALDKVSDSKQTTIILINLGKVNLETGRFRNAESLLDSAIHLASRYGQREFLSEAYFRKYELFEKQHRVHEALDYYILYSTLQDSLINDKTTEQVANMKVRYETEQKEKQLLTERAEKERLAKENALTEIRVYNRNKWIIGISSVSIILILSGLVINQRRQRKNQAEKDAAVISEREKGIRAVFEAQEEERQRIAKDLHDGVGQQISAIGLKLQSLAGEPVFQQIGLQPELKGIQEMVIEAGSDIRSLSHQMMPRSLTELGLVDALHDLADKSFTNSGITCRFEHHGIIGRLPQHIEVGLYRITQELINNIIKHSGAKTVNIQLMKQKNFCILIVQDNGRGLNRNSKIDGIGMLNINSRLRTLSGEMNLESEAGEGTTATIRIALHEQGDKEI